MNDKKIRSSHKSHGSEKNRLQGRRKKAHKEFAFHHVGGTVMIFSNPVSQNIPDDQTQDLFVLT